MARVFIPVSDFSFPGIGNGKMSFPGIPGIPGMQGVTQWVVSTLSFHHVDAVNALHAFVQPFRRTAGRLQDGRAQFTLGRITGFSLRKCPQIASFLYSTNSAIFICNLQ